MIDWLYSLANPAKLINIFVLGHQQLICWWKYNTVSRASCVNFSKMQVKRVFCLFKCIRGAIINWQSNYRWGRWVYLIMIKLICIRFDKMFDWIFRTVCTNNASLPLVVLMAAKPTSFACGAYLSDHWVATVCLYWIGSRVHQRDDWRKLWKQDVSNAIATFHTNAIQA